MDHDSSREVLVSFEQMQRLVEVTDADGAAHLAVEVLDEFGHVAEVATFDQTDFRLAAADYGQRLIDRLGFVSESAFVIGFQCFTASAEFDGPALASGLHDDFVFVDRRPIGFPDLDKAAVERYVLADSHLPQVWLYESIDAATTEVAVSTGGFWTLDHGHWGPFLRGTYLGVVSDGRLSRVEVFPEDQLDAVLALFAQLTPPTSAEE